MGLARWALSLDEQGWEGKLPEGRAHLDPASAFWGRGVEKVHCRETGLSF